MTQSDIVDYVINVGKELNETNEVYQSLLYSLKYNEYHLVEATLSEQHSNISEYMKTSTKILKSYLPHIKKTLSTPYHNGFVEGNNNFIKVLKRIAFGLRSSRRFKARIMICKNLLYIKKVNAYLASTLFKILYHFWFSPII